MMGFLVLVVLLAGAFAAPVVLPDYTGPTLSLDSGYIQVNATTGRNVFYILSRALSQSVSSSTPLLFWYQGGPGCSGLGGFFQEHGPVQAAKNGGVNYRQINWNQFAHIVFLESPAGVGFSYSKSSYTPSDSSTALDNVAFVKGFLKQYPEFASSPVWLTGESYAGTYVPLLARELTRDPSQPIYSQLAGFAVGNPVFRCNTLDEDDVDVRMSYGHGLVSYSNYNAWRTQCAPVAPANRTTACANLLTKIMTEVGIIDQQLLRKARVQTQPSLDPDDLYQDFCTGNGTLDFITSEPEKCSSVMQLTDAYLSRLDVQQALHVSPAVQGLKWTECNDAVNSAFVSDGGDMNAVYADIFKQKSMPILVYSGDVDILTVSFMQTQYCLNLLANTTLASETKSWGPWTVNGYTAGYWEAYSEFTYATIKGAGHEAMQYQPLSSINMIERFIASQSLVDPNATSTMMRRPSVRQGDALRKHNRMNKRLH